MRVDISKEENLFDCQPFFESSQNLLGILDRDLRLKATNPIFTYMLGIHRQNLLGQGLLQFIHADDRAAVAVGLKKLLSEKGARRFNTESRMRIHDGEFRWMDCHYWILKESELIYFVGVHKTEAKRNETFLREIQRCARVGGWEIDVTTEQLFWSDETYHILGMDPRNHEISLRDAYKCYRPDCRAGIERLVESSLREYKSWETDTWIVRDGKEVPVRVVGKVDFKDGKLARLYGTFQDISEQKANELELIERERRLNLVIEAGHIGFWTWDMQLEQVTFSERLCEMLGLKYSGAKQDMGDWTDRIHPEDLPEYLIQLKGARTCSTILLRTTMRVRHENGHWLEILSRGKVVSFSTDGKPEEFIGILTDVTVESETQRRMADQIQKSISSQKLAALGEMAAGIAHEINNPLAVIAGRAANLVRRLKAAPFDMVALSRDLSLIEETVFRIAKIISGLSHFAHESDQDPKSEELFSTILEDTLAFCSEKFKINGVRLTINDRASGACLLCSPLQISQVMLNLLNNAYDAVKPLSEKWVMVEVETEADALRVAVVDSGHGIAPDVESKMMIPFYSTKDIGKGTGLGLSISKGIIESHQGKFYYRPKAANTCFVFELPLVP